MVLRLELERGTLYRMAHQTYAAKSRIWGGPKRRYPRSMSDGELLALRLVVGFVVAGSFVATMAWIAERFGSKLGGFLLALPVTSVVALVVIVISQGSAALVDVVAPMPATFAASAVFLMVFARLSKQGLVVAYLGAITAWLGLTVPIAVFELSDFRLAIVTAVVLLSIVTWFFRHVPHRQPRRMPKSVGLTTVRFLIAGTVSALAILAANVLGPIWAAVFASFPAAFSSSLILLTRTQGIEFSTSLGRTMAVGSVTSVMFTVVLYLYASTIGGLSSIVAAYVTTLFLAGVSYRYLLDAVGAPEPLLSAGEPEQPTSRCTLKA